MANLKHSITDLILLLKGDVRAKYGCDVQKMYIHAVCDWVFANLHHKQDEG